jgi:hypothetical protein
VCPDLSKHFHLLFIIIDNNLFLDKKNVLKIILFKLGAGGSRL